MLGGVAVFMYGMKQMSQVMEQGVGATWRNLFKKINKNSAVNYGVGIGTTAIVQSSSATSIMTVGLANAGIVDVKQGSGIILGAKVGTTLTAFIFALSGINKGSFSMSAIFSALAFIGVILIYTTNKDSLSKVALFLLGFGMLFVGLEVMEFAIGGSDSLLSMQLQKLFQYDIMYNPILLVLLGMLFTGIIQSSTAATGLFLIFLTTGVIGSIDQSFFLIMGANIGTCSDGLMASIGTNSNGKRIAIFHVLTSTIGALAFSVILMMFRLPITNMFEGIFPDNPQWSLATFNLVYNVLYTLVLLVFLNPLVDLVKKIVKDKKSKTAKTHYIDERLLATPQVALDQAVKEVSNMAIMAHENFSLAFNGLMHEDMSQSKKIANMEYQVDDLTRALVDYFIKISSTAISAKSGKLIGSLHHITNDIERIGDHAVLLAKETNYMKQLDVRFIDETKAEMEEINSKISKMFELSLEAFNTRDPENLEEISEIHVKIISLIATATNANVLRLNSNMYSIEVSKSFYAALLSLQRVADHIVNIGFSIGSDTGSKAEVFGVESWHSL